MRRFVSISAVVLSMPAYAESQEIPHMDDRGAVLCSYAFTAVMEKYARQCAQDNEAQEWLGDLLNRHRDFVRRNIPVPDAELDAFEIEQTSLPNGYKFCDAPDISEMFEATLEHQKEFRAKIEESLSFDRKPVWNPCF